MELGDQGLSLFFGRTTAAIKEFFARSARFGPSGAEAPRRSSLGVRKKASLRQVARRAARVSLMGCARLLEFRALHGARHSLVQELGLDLLDGDALEVAPG